MSMAAALNAALRNRMEHDPKVLVMGLDVGKLGGVFRITDGLQKDFGEDRVIDSPLAESGIVGITQETAGSFPAAASTSTSLLLVTMCRDQSGP